MKLIIKISDAQKKTLEPYAAPLISALAEIDGHHKKYSELAKKDQSAEKQVIKHQRAAAGFDSASELQLIAALKQRERLRDALGQIEEHAAEAKQPLFQAIDRAQDALQQILQGAYKQLLENIVSEAGTFFDNADSLRFQARDWPAARTFVHQLLTHHVAQNDSTDRLVSVANELLSRVDALLDGKFSWTFQGINGAAK